MPREGKIKLGQVVDRVQTLSARGKREKDARSLGEQRQNTA